MNLILLFDEDFVDENIVRLSGRRLHHVRDIHRAQAGDSLVVGKINGELGVGRIVKLDKNELILEIELHSPPPAPLPLTLILALPRPRVLNRTLIAATSMGVKQIYLVHTNRVEKSFWHSPVLEEDKIRDSLVLGLEQAKDTIMPIVHLRKKFRPFMEDALPDIAKNTRKIVAHPDNLAQEIIREMQPTTLFVGPEGGFIPYEIEKLQSAGFHSFSLGERILRVETAVPVLITKLMSR
ncbi:MAG: 16S rRNA (uracil(1498)-N(3))-methyltransferase [Deferribacteres bacterium]|nr:16S rRNA (uracil(1498)-N(3))-methyltransferase [candidate division KSB1 bacterium]MCB9501673.1 16S rRNA (uracil(1498)-N(3))-methyltransferase [Deferribacteres bacterium]